jgi:Na+/H+ antiporter NhaD/arsenite permease-like protein
MLTRVLLAAAALGLCAAPSYAAGSGIDGKELGLLWVVPFAGILLSIAVFPLVAPKFWHHHFGKISAFWAAAFIIPAFVKFGGGAIGHDLVHVYALEYIPFIILLGGLFTTAGGVLIKGSFKGTPTTNTAILAIGTAIASFVGTTGASMLLIRPILRANKTRKSRAHTIVFFIFLVSNIGGSLTPLGDPPLFLGFLKGVPFFWTMTHIWPDTLLAVAVLLPTYFILDTILYKKDGKPFHGAGDGVEPQPFGIEGKINLVFLLGIVAAVYMSGTKTFVDMGTIDLPMHIPHKIGDVLRDGIIVVMSILSLKFTTRALREANGFDWGPILEVAKLFAGIFACMLPAVAILKAGKEGEFAGLIGAVTHPHHYFWITGALSSFLDNAPTYLVFFETAQATPMAEFAARGVWGQTDPVSSTPPIIDMPSAILAAISAGAVFMGANSYIGNGPNFMVKSIADADGVPMPSFFGYIFKWAIPFLIPTFVLMTFCFFMPA